MNRLMEKRSMSMIYYNTGLNILICTWSLGFLSSET